MDCIVNIDWSLALKELDHKNGDTINIGWYCSGRVGLSENPKKLP
jgi:hypothetical protein